MPVRGHGGRAQVVSAEIGLCTGYGDPGAITITITITITVTIMQRG